MSRPYRMKLSKRILKSPHLHTALSYVAAFVLRAIYFTCRVQRDYPAAAQPYFNGQHPGLICFWHGRMIMQPFVRPPGRAMHVLVSRHNDGALIYAVMQRFRVDAARGSKKSGAAEAVRTLLGIAKQGSNIAITPDGPRGPFQIAAEGTVFIASKTGYPLLPLAFSASRHWRLKSWDRFMIPKPFSRIQFTAGEPIFLPRKLDTPAVRAATEHLQSELNSITAQADATCGVAA